MYQSINQFVRDWTEESERTLTLFKTLTNESLNQKVWEDGRTLGRIAWHLVQTVGEMGEKMGLPIDAPSEDSETPADADTIITGYDKARRSLIEIAPAKLTDNMLDDEVDAYGSKWTRRMMMQSLVRHQIHHRGQMTVLMRQAGIKIPGIYGPSLEEWAQWGMPPAV